MIPVGAIATIQRLLRACAVPRHLTRTRRQDPGKIKSG
jgi:hypothetical protein